jgi:hypothetical protein
MKREMSIDAKNNKESKTISETEILKTWDKIASLKLKSCFLSDVV